LPIEIEERIDRFSDPNFLHHANDDAVGADFVLQRLPTKYHRLGAVQKRRRWLRRKLFNEWNDRVVARTSLFIRSA
jgi:hypothetical protein